MPKLKDMLWNWGHLEGSHNKICGLDCKMTPEEFAKEYEIPNAFIVSYGGNITPPFDALSKRFSGLKEVVWSVLGDASTPLPDDRLGNTNDILKVTSEVSNITGGVVDDFFSPERMKRFTPEVLMEIKNALNKNGLEFWCVLYAHQLDEELEKYLECFDGITFWLWESEKINDIEKYYEKFFDLAKDKKIMPGIYLWEYSLEKPTPIDSSLFEKQLKYCFELMRQKKISGTVFCSSTIGDAELDVNGILKEYIRKYGDEEF